MGVTSYLSTMDTNFVLCGLGPEQLRMLYEIQRSRRPAFVTVSFHTKSVVEEVALGWVSMRKLRYLSVRIIPPSLLLIFISILFLSEGESGDAWEL